MYKVVLDDGILKIFTTKERTFQKVTLKGEDIEVDNVPYPPGMASSPVIACNYAGNGYLNCDIDAGCQRWNGPKSMRWLRKSLYQIGFSKKEVDDMWKYLKKFGEQTSIRRWY